MAATPTLVVHGGAGALIDGQFDVDGLKAGIQQAAREGYKHLVGGSTSALDAVEAAVCSLEDNPFFNAGKGSSLTIDGTVEMDAIIMEGAELRTGSVGCVRNIKNPVSLARMVMEKTEHILLVGDGANKFASEMGVPAVPSEDLITERRLRQLKQHQNFETSVKHLYKEKKIGIDDHDTVGAVAVDAHGNVACATSTGGITAQLIGRVGDSPIIGSGGYCDNAIGAVSTTGHGEGIAKVTLARKIIFHMEQEGEKQRARRKTHIGQERTNPQLCSHMVQASRNRTWATEFIG